MPLANPATHFGTVSRVLHWSVFVLFLYQFVGANVMTRLPRGAEVLGMDGNFFYNWHKSIGLSLLLLATVRIAWRRTVALPDWPASLTDVDRAIAHRLESALYWLMFLMPITGYLFVMAGGYGVKLFGVHDLDNPIGKQEWLAGWAQFAHVTLSYAIVIVVGWHVGLGLRKHVFERTGFLDRMLPFRRP